MKSFRISFFLGATLLFFASFAFNIFDVGVNDSWFADFEQGSSRIVKQTADCKKEANFYSGPLIYKNYHGDNSVNLDSCSEKDLTPYASQFGLQSRLVAFFAPTSKSSLEVYFKSVELFLAVTSAILFAILCTKIKKQFGTITASSVAVLLSISPWIVGYARNMYWTLPLLVAPFIFAYCLYDRRKTRLHNVLFYIGIGVLFLLKMLDGYEHITTMVASVFAVIVFYEYKHEKAILTKLLKPLLAVVLTAFVSFIFAISIHVVALNEYYHNTERSLDAVTARAGARGGTISSIKEVQPNVIYALKVTLPDVYRAIDYYHDLDSMSDGKSNPLLYFAISVMNYALLPAVNLPIEIKGIFGVVIQSISAVGLTAYLFARRIKDRSLRHRLLAAGALGLAGSLSWLILMPAHAYPHAFLNGIIFYVPFLVFAYVVIGVKISSIVRPNKGRDSAKRK